MRSLCKSCPNRRNLPGSRGSPVGTLAALETAGPRCDSSRTAGLELDDGEVMAKRILVPVERTKEMEFALRVVQMIARESGGRVRLLAVRPIPEPLRDWRGLRPPPTRPAIPRLAPSPSGPTAPVDRLHPHWRAV